jgi:citrate lyase subunit beta/citryl-CoA lyase
MPGANPKALEKAKTLAADALIFDLEDSVAPEGKADARGTIAAALAGGGYGAREIIVRVNALSTPWGADDVKAAVAARPHGVLFPKILTAADIDAADAALKAAGGAGIALWAMIETPLAILSIRDIAEKARSTALCAFVMGTNDLAKDMHCALDQERTAMLAALSLTVMAGRAYGVALIDGVYNDIANPDGFAAVCRQGLALGFDGKTLIHPTQVEPANTIFAPTPDEIAWARDVIAAFADPENAGKGVLKVAGKMTELLHLDQANRTVAIADAIAAMG